MKDLVKKSKEDLIKELNKLKEKIREVSFSPAGNTKDSFNLRKTKKKVAQILTILNNKNKKH
ncbi:MAG: 50S ribosomal protein L29 [Candidatus Pacebacteria bacterium]|nr:50S ribosomal protein L29 [Candidatus Paceibacterota bacterium]